MRLCRLSFFSEGTFAALAVAALVLAAPFASASSCTTQAAMSAQDRAAIAAAAERIGQSVLQQDTATLRADLLPAIADQWDGIQNEAQQGAPLVKNGHLQLRNAYLLDATTNTAAADTQFFCSNSSATITVTITMRDLPPGRYAVVLADVPGSAMNAQLGIVLVWDTTGAAPAWKLGGLSVRQGSFDKHDGLWFWTHARALSASGAPWSAFYCYEAARYLLVPVEFLSSPNLDKLSQEQSQIAGSPTGAFPLTLPDGARTWKILSLHLDTSLHEADLGVTYESLGISDPAAARTEATAVLSALLKAHPELRQDFHGLWAYASKDGKITPVLELPMAQIP